MRAMSSSGCVAGATVIRRGCVVAAPWSALPFCVHASCTKHSKNIDAHAAIRASDDGRGMSVT
jgi:hypothetical protein